MMQANRNITVDDVVRADVPGDAYWWRDEDHQAVFDLYCRRRGVDGVEFDTLVEDYCESLPLDEYGQGNVYAFLMGDPCDG